MHVHLRKIPGMPTGQFWSNRHDKWEMTIWVEERGRMQGGTDKNHQRGKIKSFWLATGISKFLSSLNTVWDESKVTGKSCKR